MVLPEVVEWNTVSEKKDTVVTLGNFDGVHLGHCKILEKLKEKSESLGLKPIVITFDPHPRHFFSKGQNSLLTTIEEKHAKLKLLGISDVYFIRFNKQLSELSPDDFFHNFLIEKLRAKAIVLGENHRFGKNAMGDANFLRERLKENSERLTIVKPIEIESEVVCSTLIRKKLSEGKITEAGRLLGYPYTYTGTVVEGDKRGKSLGYPTANLELADPNKMMVLYGVYGCFVWVDDQKFAGIANVGKKPTFPCQNAQIEVHILQFKHEIYGKKIHLELHFFLRKEKLFKSGEELSYQIQVDLTEYKQILKKENKSIL